jgi:hypothetical protein
MKNNLLKYYIAAFYLYSTFAMFAQDPGTGGGIENDGTEDRTPAAPIDHYVMVLAFIGLVYVFLKLRDFAHKGNTLKE